jgi:hypothetical protein
VDKACRDLTKGCEFFGAMPPRVQSDIGGFHVCGRRDADPLINRLSAHEINGKLICDSEGYEPCDSSGKHTACFKTSEGRESCPITDFEFVHESDINHHEHLALRGY